ncbi:MAG: hypothetical protein AAF371_03775 [Pseudomonadota bacterium]
MSRTGFALSVLAILVVAAWAYNVNYRTGEALDRVEALRDEIARTREDVQVLRVEWAWLNSPKRLAKLVGEHQAALGLEPMAPERFGETAQVPFQPPAGHDALEAALEAALFGAERSIIAQEVERGGGAAPVARPDPRLLPLLEVAPPTRLLPVMARPDGAAGPFATDGLQAAEAVSSPEGTDAALAAAIDEAVRQTVGQTLGQTVGQGAVAHLSAEIPAPEAASQSEAPLPGYEARSGGQSTPVAVFSPAVTPGLARVVSVGGSGGSVGGRVERSTQAADPNPSFLSQVNAAGTAQPLPVPRPPVAARPAQ